MLRRKSYQVGQAIAETRQSGAGPSAASLPFTVWTLTARVTLRLKSFDSRAAWRMPTRTVIVPGLVPDGDRSARARECRTGSGNGAAQRIRGASDSRGGRRFPSL